MSLSTIVGTVILAFLPISELRGAIPFAVARGVPLLQAAGLAIACNVLVGPVALIFLETFHRLLYRWEFYAHTFDRFVAGARAKVHEKVERYGYWGIMLFVAIPLPVTGAWTGTLGAWILGMDRKKTMLAVAAGVVLAGMIVSAVIGLGIGALSIFLKRV